MRVLLQALGAVFLFALIGIGIGLLALRFFLNPGEPIATPASATASPVASVSVSPSPSATPPTRAIQLPAAKRFAVPAGLVAQALPAPTTSTVGTVQYAFYTTQSATAEDTRVTLTVLSGEAAAVTRETARFQRALQPSGQLPSAQSSSAEYRNRAVITRCTQRTEPALFMALCSVDSAPADRLAELQKSFSEL